LVEIARIESRVMGLSTLARTIGKRDRYMKQAFNNLMQSLATGYILFFYSERVFWAVWWPGTNLLELCLTWLAYSIITYLFLAVVSWSRADDFWSILLTGAVYGWLVEGVLANTLYGTQPSAPFPASISITGLSWHALVSVMLGWWATGRALRARGLTALTVVVLALGTFWGVWAMFPRRETPPIIASVPAFFANAALLTLGLMAAWWLIVRTSRDEFRPGALGLALCIVPAGLFYFEHVRALGVRPLAILPAVLAAALVPLSRHRRCTLREMSVPPREFRPARLLVLGLLSVVATVVYACAVALRADRLPIPLIVYLVSGVAGGVLFMVAAVITWLSCNPQASSPAAGSPPEP
jgi:hypothetical protein